MCQQTLVLRVLKWLLTNQSAQKSNTIIMQGSDNITDPDRIIWGWKGSMGRCSGQFYIAFLSLWPLLYISDVFKGILENLWVDLENEFYEVLVGELIDNTFNNPPSARSQKQRVEPLEGTHSCIFLNGLLSIVIDPHFMPTYHKRTKTGKETRYLRQTDSRVCRKGTTYCCSKFWDNSPDNCDQYFWYPKTNGLCFTFHM